MLAHKKYELKTLMNNFKYVDIFLLSQIAIQLSESKTIKLIEHILALYQKVFGQSNGMKHNCRAMTRTRYAQYLLKSVTRLTFHCAILS